MGDEKSDIEEEGVGENKEEKEEKKKEDEGSERKSEDGE